MAATGFDALPSLLAEVAYECSRQLTDRSLAAKPEGEPSGEYWLPVLGRARPTVDTAFGGRSGETGLETSAGPGLVGVGVANREDLIRAAASLILELGKLDRSHSTHSAN